jgi:two-component system, LuxR family, response regulator FixJ
VSPEPTVFVVDDDPGALTSMCWLIESAKFRVEGYQSPASFLAAFDPSRPGCLVLDIRMPQINGLEVQDRLNALSSRLPVIVLTGHGDVASCARAFKAGAFDFLEKPADGQRLVERIREALAKDSAQRSGGSINPEIARRLERLTAREREALDLLVRGFSVKRLASELTIDHRTAAKHRARVHEKMGVNNDAELVRMMLGERSARPSS